MALTRPLGEFVDAGRTPKERAAATAVLASLSDVLKVDELRPEVLAFYKEPPTATGESALSADPVLLGAILEQSDVDPGLQRQILDAAKLVLRGPDGDPSGELVDEEAETARREIATFWTNAALLAWERIEPDENNDGLLLDRDTLLPPRSENNKWKRWSESVAEYRGALLSTLALTEASFDRLLRIFTERLAAKSRVDLPGGIALDRRFSLRAPHRTYWLMSTRG